MAMNKAPPVGWAKKADIVLKKTFRKNARAAPAFPAKQPLGADDHPEDKHYAHNVPILWLKDALELGRPCVRLVPVLLMRASAVQYATFAATHQELAKWGVPVSTVRKALDRLLAAHLIRMTSGIGREKTKIKLRFSEHWKKRHAEDRVAFQRRKAKGDRHA